MGPDPGVLKVFGLNAATCAPEFIAETAIARVWRVRLTDGRWAALKHYYKGRLGNEAAGLDWMAGQDPRLVARVYERRDASALIEWLAGPSLGDLARSGEDDKACALLAELAGSLATKSGTALEGLPQVADWFGDLFALEFDAACPEPLKADIRMAQELAQALLQSALEPRALHGDLHHDNVILTEAGPRAFDAKGVWADPCYELANAFRNPKGMGAALRQPARIGRFAGLAGRELGVPSGRMLQWAAAKSALSIAWTSNGCLSDSAEAPLLAALLAAVGDHAA